MGSRITIKAGDRNSIHKILSETASNPRFSHLSPEHFVGLLDDFMIIGPNLDQIAQDDLVPISQESTDTG